MSVKLSPRPRKSHKKDEVKQEIVAQVHKPVKRDVSSDRELNRGTEYSEDSSGSNRTYFLEDKNENFGAPTPNQNEMKRDMNKHNHFTDSRPQSLSFYEDEKIPEELSGNLELLSPEERKHYKRRKDHGQMDTDEINAYNTIQDIYNRENDEIILNGLVKKSKSRKKRHQDQEVGLGDSREMMIPKEKRKTKKKRREGSPMSASSGKRKHRKKEEDFEPRNDITIALEELQDDVFENSIDDYGTRHEKTRKSPRKSDRLYVQKKNKFELSNRENQSLRGNGDSEREKRFSDYYPIQIALAYQRRWTSFSTFCHGLLGGLAFAHYAFMNRNYWPTHGEYVKYIANYNCFYTCTFYFLTVICLVSVFDKYDIAQLDTTQIVDLVKHKKRSIVILIYFICIIVHLVTTPMDDQISLFSYNTTGINITADDVSYWNALSFWRSILAFLAWIIVAICPFEDLFQVHLKHMEGYIPQ